jgi:transcription elongation factor Elf1
MYNQELITLLEKILGYGYQMKNGEMGYYCPKCSHHKKKLQVNLDNGKAHCWVCNFSAHTIPQLLKKINAPKHLIKEALQIVGDYVSYEKDKDEITHNVSLPREYKPLWIKIEDPIYKNAIHYLRRRRIGIKEILRYSIGYCDGGPYSNRIIIPSYDCDGKLNYFVARDMFPNSKFKYKNPPMSKDVVGFELFINWKEPIVLVEGVFDAIAIKRNAIPLLGKFPSKKLIMKIMESGVTDIYIALDEDAKEDALKLSEFMMGYGKNVYMMDMDAKDPSDLGFTNFWKQIELTKQTGFSDLIRSRLS